jgi:Leucine-rich repeat (LRR) protein
LSDNKLESIDDDAFSGLKNLKRLVVQGCGLKSLPTTALEKLEELTSM